MEGIVAAGRIQNKRLTMEGRGRKEAETMLSQGWQNIVTWYDEYKCCVPSQTKPKEVKYMVDLARATCECPASAQGCKNAFLNFDKM